MPVSDQVANCAWGNITSCPSSEVPGFAGTARFISILAWVATTFGFTSFAYMRKLRRRRAILAATVNSRLSRLGRPKSILRSSSRSASKNDDSSPSKSSKSVFLGGPSSSSTSDNSKETPKLPKSAKRWTKMDYFLIAYSLSCLYMAMGLTGSAFVGMSDLTFACFIEASLLFAVFGITWLLQMTLKSVNNESKTIGIIRKYIPRILALPAIAFTAVVIFQSFASAQINEDWNNYIKALDSKNETRILQTYNQYLLDREAVSTLTSVSNTFFLLVFMSLTAVSYLAMKSLRLYQEQLTAGQESGGIVHEMFSFLSRDKGKAKESVKRGESFADIESQGQKDEPTVSENKLVMALMVVDQESIDQSGSSDSATVATGYVSDGEDDVGLYKLKRIVNAADAFGLASVTADKGLSAFSDKAADINFGSSMTLSGLGPSTTEKEHTTEPASFKFASLASLGDSAPRTETLDDLSGGAGTQQHLSPPHSDDLSSHAASMISIDPSQVKLADAHLSLSGDLSHQQQQSDFILQSYHTPQLTPRSGNKRNKRDSNPLYTSQSKNALMRTRNLLTTIGIVVGTLGWLTAGLAVFVAYSMLSSLLSIYFSASRLYVAELIFHFGAPLLFGILIFAVHLKGSFEQLERIKTAKQVEIEAATRSDNLLKGKRDKSGTRER
ncbi:hypothetical protein HDU76_012647 [Blyttiomyces sp. JEL0837]|nr:hypothetical protein HDU76_012647 [Blyttiomyces sp. JEL0837]